MVTLHRIASRGWDSVASIYIFQENKMRAVTTCLTSTEFALDNRRLSIVSYVNTTAWKRKQCCASLAVLSQALFGLTCSHYTQRCLSSALVCSNIGWRLFTMETFETQKLKRAGCAPPLRKVSGLYTVPQTCLTQHVFCWYNYSIAAHRCVMPACAPPVCPPILAQSSNTPPILSNQPLSQ